MNKDIVWSDWRVGGTLPARDTGLAFLKCLSLAHLCQGVFASIVAVVATTRDVTRAASWLFTITFLRNGGGSRQGR